LKGHTDVAETRITAANSTATQVSEVLEVSEDTARGEVAEEADAHGAATSGWQFSCCSTKNPVTATA